MPCKLNARYDFKNDNEEAPEAVLEDICTQLNGITKAFVKGNVKEFEGPIESYHLLSGMASLAAAMGRTEQVDIQDELGEIGEEASLKFEFFLSAPQIPNYKYRILFLEYGIRTYPVKVVLEQGIADELNGEEGSGYIYEPESRQELEELLIRVIDSKKVTDIIQDLITVSARRLRKQTKDMSRQERIDCYNSRGMEVHKEIQAKKLQKI